MTSQLFKDYAKSRKATMNSEIEYFKAKAKAAKAKAEALNLKNEQSNHS